MGVGHWRNIRTGIGRAWPAGVISGAFICISLLLSPRYEVPQNDDWAYLLTVQEWFRTGSLPVLGWNDPTLLFQLFWAAPFALILGLSYTSLRVSTLVLSWVGILAFYGILRRCGAGRALGLLGAGLLLVNPIYLAMSYSFNTDVPYVAMAMIASWVFLVALERQQIRFFAAGGLLSAGAFLIRQPGIIIPMVVGAYLLATGVRGGRRLRAILATVLPAISALVLYSLWYHQMTGGSWLSRISSLHPILRGGASGEGGPSSNPLLIGGLAGLLTLGILTFPTIVATVAALPGVFLRSRRWLDWAFAGSAQALTLVSWALILQQPGRLGSRGWPYQGNYLTRQGILPAGDEPAVAPGWTWTLLTWLAPVLAAWVVAASALVISNVRKDGADRACALILLLGLAQIAPVLVLAVFYDRYLLLILPAVIVACIRWTEPSRRAIISGFVGLLLLAVVSVEWTRSYVDRAKARWETAGALVSQGIPAREIAGGFEWEGAHLYLEAIRTLDVHPPFKMEKQYPWAPLYTPGYLLSESPRPGIHPLAERSYRPFFRRDRRSVMAFPMGGSGR